MRRLNPKQQRFAEAYAASANGTEAAIAAGYSPATAKVQSCRLLTFVHVSAEIERLRLVASAATGIDREWILRQLGALALAPRDGQPISDRTRLDVFDAIAKIIGAYAPVKTEVTLTTEQRQERLKALLSRVKT